MIENFEFNLEEITLVLNSLKEKSEKDSWLNKKAILDLFSVKGITLKDLKEKEVIFLIPKQENSLLLGSVLESFGFKVNFVSEKFQVILLQKTEPLFPKIYLEWKPNKN